MPTALCHCGDAGIGELPRGNGLEVSSRSVTVLFVGDDGLGADKSSGEEGVDGDKLDGFVEDTVGKCADGELGTDKGRQLAEAETGGGAGGVEEAGAVEKVWIRMSRGGVADVDGPCSGQSTQSQHRENGDDCDGDNSAKGLNA